ncbi:MAG: C39 family peptidase [Opitutaceae bacterium]
MDFFEAGGDTLPLWSSDFDFNPWESSDSSNNSFVGDPDGGGSWSHQGTPFTCAVVSQQMILDQFGIDVTEAQLTYDATSQGWLTDGGTSFEHVANLLESYGVDTHQGMGGGIDSLLNELAQGHKVIVGVDSGEMWGTDFPFADWIDGGEGADHAIVVNGIDASDPENIQVYVNDPGDPNGSGKAYPIEQFLDAWNDSGQFYVATDDAPGGLASDSLFGSNFDAESGWYMNQEFWTDMLASVASGFASAEFIEGVTGDGDFGSAVGLAVGIFSGFSAVIDHMPAEQIDELFYQV